jgi:hypothetical protein
MNIYTLKTAVWMWAKQKRRLTLRKTLLKPKNYDFSTTGRIIYQQFKDTASQMFSVLIKVIVYSKAIFCELN